MHIPFFIISGFLGSGKTTLVNKILAHTHGIRFAVLINELGSIGIDAHLLDGSQDFVEMDNGCLCCVLNEDLVKTLEKLKERGDFDAVILETTGVADPLPIAWAFLREQFGETFRFEGIVTVVDPLHLAQMLGHAEEAKIQIERADYIYLTKTDVASSQDIQQALNQVQQMNPQARVILQSDPAWFDLIFSLQISSAKSLPRLFIKHQHVQNFSSFALPLENLRIHLNDMEDFFCNLPQQVFRAKAIFFDQQTQKYMAMHSVCNRVDFYQIEAQPQDQAVVFIGKSFDVESLKQNFYTLVTGR